MKLLIGLGNPGRKYASSRHNAGFLTVDALVRAQDLSWSMDTKRHAEVAKGLFDGTRVLLAKPQTFMNASGDAVASLVRFSKVKPTDLLVIHDDLDLAPGVIRLTHEGGTAGHKGLDSICAQLGTKAFDRLRIGIGKPMRKTRMDSWVLGKISSETLGAIQRAVAAAHDWTTLGMSEAMNRWNRKPPELSPIDTTANIRQQ